MRRYTMSPRLNSVGLPRPWWHREQNRALRDCCTRPHAASVLGCRVAALLHERAWTALRAPLHG